MDRPLVRAWIALATITLVACARPDDTRHAGSAACAQCHRAEYRAWSTSHHARAMRAAAPDRVVATFDGALRHVSGIRFRPVRHANALALEIASAEDTARPRVVELAYVLGGATIEQFVARGAGGRYQPFPAAYDTRVGEWFDVEDEPGARDDSDRWDAPGAAANTQCLVCHTTGYEKGYRTASEDYDTRWAEMGVGCEACHGPGATHVARRRRGLPEARGSYGAVSSRPQAMAGCEPCHNRRIALAPAYVPGAPLYDFFDFELLDTSAYHADGQLHGEAYEWTSFQMSRMATRGVVCADCHEPHAAQLRAPANDLCLRCHVPELSTAAHTHHASGSAGAACVGCHMPVTRFMQRDPRHDHQFARPDPEGAAAVGAPDACTRCHTEKPWTWAAERVHGWYGPSATLLARRSMAATLDAARRGREDAVPALLALLRGDVDATRRASAGRLLGAWTSRADVRAALIATAADPHPLVRAGALDSLGRPDVLDAAARVALLRGVRDPARLVRVVAAFGLRSVQLTEVPPAQVPDVEAAFGEWLGTTDQLAELAEPQYNRGIFLAARGKLHAAEAAYRLAIARSPGFLAARQNLAHLLAGAGRETDAEVELRRLLDRERWEDRVWRRQARGQP